MARKGFNIRTALRMMPQELLGECFQEMEVWDQRIAWFLLLDNKVDPILNYLCEISSVKRDEIETFLRAISDLACDSGYEAILESAPLCAVWDLPGEVPTDLCLWGRTMWVWLHRRNIFDKAQLIHRVETLPWWRKRNDLPQIEANTSAVARDALANEISEMLREEGRGKQCTVEYMHHDSTTYFFAYADDYLQNLNVHNEEGKLIAITQRQTLQVAFSFNGDQGTLQTFAKLRKPFKERLEKMFSRNILAYDLGRHEPEPAYELEHLKGGMRNLEVDPADEIQVSIRRLRLASGAPWRRVMVEIDGSEREYHMDIAVPDCLNLENIPLNNWGVSLVGFCFEFLPKPGRKPGRTSFDIVYPHSNNLRDVAPERLQIIEKYLRLWGIERVSIDESTLITVAS
ncbi:hypothetical protein NA78x_002814 [Anatilimnocola sp. NA78]|uniref:hypothetical protein n=1 Tax=Anatilimnocola sp. NA78 TaxID=3415683 RepID=UPI003CE448AF